MTEIECKINRIMEVVTILHKGFRELNRFVMRNQKINNSNAKIFDEELRIDQERISKLDKAIKLICEEEGIIIKEDEKSALSKDQKDTIKMMYT